MVCEAGITSWLAVYLQFIEVNMESLLIEEQVSEPFRWYQWVDLFEVFNVLLFHNMLLKSGVRKDFWKFNTPSEKLLFVINWSIVLITVWSRLFLVLLSKIKQKWEVSALKIFNGKVQDKFCFWRIIIRSVIF